MADNAQNFPTDVPTTLKLLINEWAPLKELILQEIHDTQPAEDKPDSPLLSDQVILDLVFGPMKAFFKPALTAYGLLAQVRMTLSLEQNENFKYPRTPLPPRLSKLTLSDLEDIQKTLNQFCQTQYQKWRSQLKEWNQKFVFHLSSENIHLSNIELQDLQQELTLSGLKRRFIDLQIEQPSWENLDFEKYFRAKIYLIVHSSLSRRHQPHDSSAIQKALKKLKTVFSMIRTEEKMLIQSQKQEYTELLGPIVTLLRIT